MTLDELIGRLTRLRDEHGGGMPACIDPGPGRHLVSEIRVGSADHRPASGREEWGPWAQPERVVIRGGHD